MALISSVSAGRRTMSKYRPVTTDGHEMCNAPQDDRRLDRRPDNHPVIGDHVKIQASSTNRPADLWYVLTAFPAAIRRRLFAVGMQPTRRPRAFELQLAWCISRTKGAC
jgi:hypothetical protein